jgi:hypothetical protein
MPPREEGNCLVIEIERLLILLGLEQGVGLLSERSGTVDENLSE